MTVERKDDRRPASGGWPRVKALFQESLDRDPQRRAAFLAESCDGEPALRKDVEALLAAHDESAGFLESPAGVDRMAAGLFGRGEPTRALAIGGHVGPYEILALLRTGGVGEVYRARDGRLGRDVAVKVLQPQYAKDLDRLRRFESEARAAGAINDANIVTVLDVGSADGKPYLVSELLEGETLGQRLRGVPLGAAASAECAAQIARGLAAAHDKGIVHRDLKPDNVFLTTQGTVKILDFGVAKLLHIHQDGEPPAPAEGHGSRSTLMGTPGYIAPELLEGRPADHRADIFALGAVLYRMLAGRSAFGAESTVEGLRATLTREPLAFSSADSVPAALERIAWRCLQKRPEDRFQSAREVQIALEEFVRGSEPRQSSRSRWAASAVAAGVVACAFAVFVVGRSGPRGPEAAPGRVRSLAVLPIETASSGIDQEILADGLTDGLIAEIGRAESGSVRVISRASTMAFKNSEVDVPGIGRALAVDTVVQGTVRRTGQEVRLDLRLVRAATLERIWTGTYDGRMNEILALQRRAAEALISHISPSDPPHPRLPHRQQPESVEAYEAYLRGRHYWNLRSEEGVSKAIGHFNRALDLDPLYAEAYTGLADALATLGDMLYLMPSKEAFARAEAASLRALELDPTQAEAHATLGHLRMHAWRWMEADREFQKAIALNPDYATAHHWRAFNLASLGRGDEAIASIQRAQRLDPLSPIINADLAQILFFTGHLDDAAAQSRRTLQASPGFAEAQRILFLALLHAHRRGDALRELEAYGRLPDGGPGASMGYAYAMLGLRSEALRVLKEEEGRPRKDFVPPYNLAVIHAGLGDIDLAFSLLDESVAANDTESMILPVDPRLDSLRADPRFAALLRRMGLPLHES